MGVVYNSNMDIHIIYNVWGMRLWPFTFTHRPLRLQAKTDNSHSIWQTSPTALTSFPHSFIQPPSMNESFLYLLYCCPSFSPISQWSEQVSFSMSFNCMILSYTTLIERHPTMTIILCSDGSAWEHKNTYENCSSCQNEAQWQVKKKSLFYYSPVSNVYVMFRLFRLFNMHMWNLINANLSL